VETRRCGASASSYSDANHTGAKQPESRLQRTIIAGRNEIWATVLHLLNQVIAELREDPDTFTSTHRLADFHGIGRHITRILGIEDLFHTAMEGLDDMQLHLLGEDDDRVEVFGSWLEGRTVAFTETTITTTALLKELCEQFSGLDRNFPFHGTSTLGTWLGRHKDVIRARFGVEVKQVFSGHKRAWSLTRPTCEPVTRTNREPNSALTPAHTFTPISSQTAHIDDGIDEEFNLDDPGVETDSGACMPASGNY
jgi:hypothetical protein